MSELADRNLRLLKTGEYHDFVIKCGAREFKVHRNIVCPQSSFLRALCSPTWKEGNEGVVSLEEQDPDIVELALTFLYSGAYHDGGCANSDAIDYRIQHSDCKRTNADATGNKGFMKNVQVYVLADYLDIDGLKSYSLISCNHYLTMHFVPTQYVETITYALANTKPTDVDLRGRIFTRCADKDLTSCPELAQVLQDAEPLAWSLLQEQKQIMRVMDNSFTEVVRQKTTLTVDLEHREKDLARAKENIDTAVRLVNSHKACRNGTCDKEFGASLEIFANGFVKSLRCNRCRCRHTQVD